MHFAADGFELAGSNFTVAPLKNNRSAFANRSFVWRSIPAMFANWQFTQTTGGGRATITVQAGRAVTILVATADAQPGVDLSGWTRVADQSFNYNDAKRTVMSVYRKRLGPGETMPVPQGNWSGTLVLLPPPPVLR